MEYGTIEREIHIEATPEIVYEVITTPEHIALWWGFDADFPAAPGGTGHMSKPRRSGTGTFVTPLSVVEADAPRRFVFRWVHPDGETATAENSLLVTFELAPSRGGTLLRMTEAGFREIGWEAARLEEQYGVHVTGWDEHLPNLASYVAGLVRA